MAHTYNSVITPKTRFGVDNFYENFTKIYFTDENLFYRDDLTTGGSFTFCDDN